MRDGTWWQHHGDHWYHWSPDVEKWELGAAPPPPPPPAPAPGIPVAQPHHLDETEDPAQTEPPEQPAHPDQPERVYSGSGAAPEDLSGGNTWSSVTLNTRPVEAAERTPQLGRTKKRVAPAKLAKIGFAVLGVAVLFGAYTYFFSGSGAPSDQDVDAAFGTLSGFEYQEPPKGLEDQINAALDEDPTLSEEISSVDFRIVQRQQRIVGAVAVIGYEPGRFGDAAFDLRQNRAFMMGFNQTGLSLPGAALKTVNRGDTTMYEIRGKGVAVVTFIDDTQGMIFSIATTDPQSARNISEQLALENL